jgi:glutamate synthase domain-containing protein 1
VRDAFACKPAVVAETDDYVAIASEFRSLAHLPHIATRRCSSPSRRRSIHGESEAPARPREFDLARDSLRS